MSKPRTFAALALLACSSGTLAACGGTEETPRFGDQAKRTTATTATTPAPAREHAGGSAPAPAPAQTTAAPAGVVAEARASEDGTPFTFRITELRRSGPTVVVNATVTSEDDDDSVQIAGLLSDGLDNRLADRDDTEQHDVFDGIALVVPDARKKYLVARDSAGRCVCSNDLSGAFAEPGEPLSLTATLAAPPPEITTVDVIVPGVKTFVDVPLG